MHRCLHWWVLVPLMWIMHALWHGCALWPIVHGLSTWLPREGHRLPRSVLNGPHAWVGRHRRAGVMGVMVQHPSLMAVERRRVHLLGVGVWPGLPRVRHRL